MHAKKITFLALMISFCSSAQISIPEFDLQGHRGYRGLRPENSIPAFLLALDSGVTTLELDVVISQDSQVVVSHEAWMSEKICTPPENQIVSDSYDMSNNIYHLNYEEIKQWDCGSQGNESFPQQEKIKTRKPLLKDVIIAVEDYIKNVTKYEIDYSIEIKSSASGDGKFHPKVAVFGDLVYNEINKYLPLNRVVIQSFDFRMLRYWNKKYPEVRLSVLIENKKSVSTNLKNLGFVPSIYSPNFNLLSQKDITLIHKKTFPHHSETDKTTSIHAPMRVIPWTINKEADMIALLKLGVDGIITDFPGRVKNCIANLNSNQK